MNPKRAKQTKRRCRSLLCDGEQRKYSLVACDNNNSISISDVVGVPVKQRRKSSFSKRFVSAAHEIVHELFHPSCPPKKNKNQHPKSPSHPHSRTISHTESAIPISAPPSSRKPNIQSTSISEPPARNPHSPSLALARKPGRRNNNNGNNNSTQQRKLKKSIPALTCYVPKYVIEGGTAPPFKKSVVTRFFRAFRPDVPVNVERIESGLSASVLYSPEIPKSSPQNNKNSLRKNGFIATSLVTNRPRLDDPNLVYRNSPYEVRVSGMMVCNYDTWGNDNELLMYSVQNDGANHGEQNETLPYIHFDYQRDGIGGSEKPNCYIPIPASKSYVVSSSGHKKKNGQDKNRKSINVQFRILELDDPSPGVKAAVKGIDEFGGALNMLDPVAPFIGALTPALSLAGAVSKRALDSYAQPDKVISIDMDFLLADKERVRQKTAVPGEYLRYGYYFFLSEPVEGKLWASVRTPKNVQLMLRQHSRKPGEMEYFPLTDVSYLVVRVTEPTDSGIRRNRRPVQLAHAHQLESIFQQSKNDKDPHAVQNAVKQLGKDLGVLHSDDEDDSAHGHGHTEPTSPPSLGAITAAKVM